MEQQECLMCRQGRKNNGGSGKPQCSKCTSQGPPSESGSSSFSADVVSSASGLLRDAFASPGNHVGATLAGALHGGDKAGPSSSAPATASSSAFQAKAGPEFSVAAELASQNESFRSRVRPPNAPREAFEGVTYDEFLQSGCGPQWHLTEEAQPSFKGKKAVYTTQNRGVTSPNHDTDLVSAWHVEYAEKGLQDRESISVVDDGHELVKLLSDPSFQPGLWTEDDHDEPYTITKEEMQIAQWFTQTTKEGESKREKLRNAVSAARSGRGFQDFASIFDEIESYHEDVWGYIRPLVEAARLEHHAAESADSGDGPAVHRLRMILAHLQATDPQNPTHHLY